MASYNKFNSFVEAIAEGKHNLGADQLKIALTNTAPSATNNVLADISEISYTNVSSRNLTTTTSVQTAGLYKLVIDDLILTASGTVPTFRYVVVYNDTATNKELIGWFDKGGAVDLTTGETFTIDADQTQGLLTIQ